MPKKIVARIPAIQTRVIRALRVCGSLKIGIPLAIASTPVSAELPEAKARKIRNRVRGCTASGIG